MSYPKPLLQDLSLKELKDASDFSKEVCEIIAELSGVKIIFEGAKSPGKQLLKCLDRAGRTYDQYTGYLTLVKKESYYRPQSKVALLIANEKYEHLSTLVTPSIDCESLGKSLRELGFITVLVNNTKSGILKEILIKTLQLIPESSYCFLIYAGHGCELINTKCLLSTDCPSENIEFNHCVTENWLLRESAKCKPELCVLIMDMCRINLDRQSNPQIYSAIPNLEEYTIHSNLLISYSTQSSSAAYECVLIEKEETIGVASYSLDSADVVRGGVSQYVDALCSRLNENDVDISLMLDRVHGDVENSIKPQRPIKVQCGVSKRFLSDLVKGDTKELWSILRGALEKYNEHCTVSM
ncbi:mucosa-associated lymphoid tissue lymphoma translocation protein 1-like [Pararge aegeria]|uniref:Jg15236 protein n=2 Tax=Pararge aegeria TaxID=116150 RepID=A0A8S4RFB0_9NEOP|nr:mucosa-associated lymphoid tissue lymphoma translocation protein 1-like [Pararge aegeria]CAH2234641.1 jg15236 [Pararge aegeria aegeria]